MWISVKDKDPPKDEPIVYARKNNKRGGWHVGIAYWTVGDRWFPEANSEMNPSGFTHWMPLPDPPAK